MSASTDELMARTRPRAKSRLGIMGASCGGYATMVGVTEFPDTFADAANLFGRVNFESVLAQSTPWMGAISTGEYGKPQTQRKLLIDLSPIHKLDRARVRGIHWKCEQRR